MVPLLTQLLGLTGVDVESYEDLGNALILSVERHEESATVRAAIRSVHTYIRTTAFGFATYPSVIIAKHGWT